jgi:hypothetical protein
MAINNMEEDKTLVNSLFTNGSDFIDLKIKSIRLEFYERITSFLSEAINLAIASFLGLFAVFFMSCGLAIWLSEIFNSYKSGFAIVGLFYAGLVVVYLIIQNARKSKTLKNLVLRKVSNKYDDFEQLVKSQEELKLRLSEKEKLLKTDFTEVKEKFNKLTDEYNRIKGQFTKDEGSQAGSPIPRVIITTAVDFLLNTFVLKNAGIIKRAVFPMIAKALVTSAVLKENKKTSLIENLKLKLSKFF